MVKLIPTSFVVLVAVSFCSTVNGQAALSSFINALMPGASGDSQGQSILTLVPQKIQNKMSQSQTGKTIMDDMNKITVSQLKQDIIPLKNALISCLSMSSIKDCISALKKVDPEVTQLLHDIKQAIMNQKSKAMSYLSSLKSLLSSSLLKNILQTVMNIIQPPSSRRRRKRDLASSISSLKQAAMTLPQIKAIVKQLLQKILAALNAPEPPSPPSLLQQLINMVSKLSPLIKQLFSNPAVMKLLGTSPPS